MIQNGNQPSSAFLFALRVRLCAVPCFCSVVRIGRSGRGCADTAHSTELRLADMKAGGEVYPQMTQMFTDEGEDREGAGNRVLAWSPSVEILQPICG